MTDGEERASRTFGRSFKSESLDGLIDVERLSAWLDAQGLEPGAPLEVRRLGSGASNESFALRRAGERWVLRRPARRALEGADRGMEREHRVLRALDGTPVPHPRPVALCTDPAVLGCTFYVMEHVEGWSSLEPRPAPFRDDPQLRRDVALAYMEALGELARVDWRARGLGDFGRPEGFHERQVERWMRQLASYRARELPGLREAGEWLAANRPREWTPGIMHGDYHPANALVAPEPPARVAAILDWETATIGDPALDLGGFLRMWFEPGRSSGEVTREEMIATWERCSGRAAPDLRYYTTLSAFRLAVLLEGVYQRALQDPTRGPAEGMGDMVLELARFARDATRG